MILNVLTDYEPRRSPSGSETSPLRQKSTPTLITEEVKDLVRDLKDTMLSQHGIGLAAPQVGVNLRVIVIQLIKSGKLVGSVQEMINPVITKSSTEIVEYEEGCLSIPGEYYSIKRPSTIDVKFQTLNGRYKRWYLRGLEARVVQHELDHLNGVLMIDHL